MSFINEKVDYQDMPLIFKDAFLDYAMSVIVSRALPDVRDGLKPVHRRILYAMHDLGMHSHKPHKKSARIVGEVIGKYHPHGDSAVYDSMVRLTQDFNMNVPLINGHGNFGSIDGDAAAAMRYTEARLEKISNELLRDLHKDTVDYEDNYDGSEREPHVLPSVFPNLLVNGGEGIAVGMASKIPPHNLKEVVEAVIAQMENPVITAEELMTIMPGPDFPHPCVVMGKSGIKEAFNTGRGVFKIRGIVDVVSTKKKNQIIIRSVPYQVNPEMLVKRIYELQGEWDHYVKERAKKKKVERNGLIDFVETNGISNQADRNNPVHIIITLKKEADPDLVLNYLYKKTDLEKSFGYNMVALVPEKGKDTISRVPSQLSLKEIIAHYIDHQVEVLTRSLQFDLKKQEEKMHLLSGFIKALDDIDETVRIIRESTNKPEAMLGLMNHLHIDEIQAENILDRKLQTLANFEQDKLRLEHEERGKEIILIKEKLENPSLIHEDIKETLKSISSQYGKPRQTTLTDDIESFDDEDLITNDDVVVTITHDGLIKRTLESTYRTQRRKGIGVSGMKLLEDDFIRHLHVAKNKDTLLFFTNQGKVYKKKVYEISESTSNNRGTNVELLLDLEHDERIQAILAIREFSSSQKILFVTKNGHVKKTPLSAFGNIRQNGIISIRMKPQDSLIGVCLTSDDRNITLVTRKAISITFEGSSIRPMSRTAAGLRGIRLNEGDTVVSFAVHEEEADLFVATNQGFGKRTPLGEFRVQKRAGKGVRIAKLNDKNGEVIGTLTVQEEDTVMLMTKNGTLMKMKAEELSQFGRVAQGTKIINLRDGDELSVIARIPDEEERES
ncbi:DNA gyrase subunit A (plasmid) [Pontibacillus sp. ALD_SL1]|uniref:DNA gyrase subunit A n=1 Tax=Pontibacillus sp. ALD_SL1 TaxID=2777185 RepID=UPI001A96F7EE|nr:DNA gyrase subunit A [Pontibacillus sp. ALD_SL1]QST02915.1 DNA gyrase subunit A [Pontibacillus sp. ALD_SL1]